MVQYLKTLMLWILLFAWLCRSENGARPRSRSLQGKKGSRGFGLCRGWRSRRAATISGKWRGKLSLSAVMRGGLRFNRAVDHDELDRGIREQRPNCGVAG